MGPPLPDRDIINPDLSRALPLASSGKSSVMNKSLLAGALFIAVAVALAVWGIAQRNEAAEAASVAAEARAGRSDFENDSEIKQRLIETADRNAAELTTSANSLIGAACCAGLGIGLCTAAARRRKTGER